MLSPCHQHCLHQARSFAGHIRHRSSPPHARQGELYSPPDVLAANRGSSPSAWNSSRIIFSIFKKMFPAAWCHNVAGNFCKLLPPGVSYVFPCCFHSSFLNIYIITACYGSLFHPGFLAGCQKFPGFLHIGRKQETFGGF